MTKHAEFLKNAIIGKSVGAIARSSKYVVGKIVKDLKGVKFHSIIEYGPGDGVLTMELLKHLAPDGRMMAVELDGNFVSILKRINDPRLVVLEGSMQDISSGMSSFGFEKVDLVLSSVPFSLINKKERDLVVRNTYDSLKPDGKFIIFHQYSKIMEDPLKKYFKKIKTLFEPRNILPCFIMSAEK